MGLNYELFNEKLLLNLGDKIERFRDKKNMCSLLYDVFKQDNVRHCLSQLYEVGVDMEEFLYELTKRYIEDDYDNVINKMFMKHQTLEDQLILDMKHKFSDTVIEQLKSEGKVRKRIKSKKFLFLDDFDVYVPKQTEQLVIVGLFGRSVMFTQEQYGDDVETKDKSVFASMPLINGLQVDQLYEVDNKALFYDLYMLLKNDDGYLNNFEAGKVKIMK